MPPEPGAGRLVPGSLYISHRGFSGEPWGRQLLSLLHCLWELHASLAPPFPCVYCSKVPALCGLFFPHCLTAQRCSVSRIHSPQVIRGCAEKERLWLSPTAWRRFSEKSQLQPCAATPTWAWEFWSPTPLGTGRWRELPICTSKWLCRCEEGICYFSLAWLKEKRLLPWKILSTQSLWEAESNSLFKHEILLTSLVY